MSSAPGSNAAEAVELARGPMSTSSGSVGVGRPATRRPRARGRSSVEPVGVGQAEVDDREVRKRRLEQARASRRSLGLEHLVAVGGQVVGEERPGRVVVLDDQDRGRLHVHDRQSLKRATIHPRA